MVNHYKTYFESLPCYLTIHDRNYHIIDANRKFVREFGDYKDRYCYQVYKQRPEECEVCPVHRTFREGVPQQTEELLITKDGKEVWVLVNTTPIFSENGKIDSVMEMAADITETKLLQRKLRRNQEKYRVLFEEVPCFISIQDRELKILEANRMHREAFGTSYGSKCYEVYKHRSTACLPCIVRDTFHDGIGRTQEEVVTSRHKKRMNVLVYTAPIRNSKGEIVKVVEMSADITPIRQLQDKLSSVGLLISSISHGIKGLLNGLDGGIYLVNSGLKKDDRKRIDQGWEIALRNVDRIRTMVMDILYYAKDREPNYETLDAAAFLLEVCNMMKEKAKKLNIRLECNITADVGKFEADPQSFRSLLVNLLENSQDACRIDTQKEEHIITVGLRGNADKVFYEISDNGIGMDREMQEKAFSMFFSSKGAGGTGLGLFISNKIALAHGGKISIQSEEGVGSTFVVEMPRRRPKKVVLVEPEIS